MKVGYTPCCCDLLPLLCTFVCSEHLIHSAVDCQCEQNLVLPGFDLPQIQDYVDYNHSLCFTCNQNSFFLEAMGNGQTLVNMNTSLVMISTTLVPGKFVLVIPDPHNALGSDSATIACSGESYHISELGKRTQCIIINIAYNYTSSAGNIKCNGLVKCNVLFLVFNPPTLSPSGSTSVVEGANVPLFCSSNLNNLIFSWTRSSTQLASASSTSSLTHTITNIMHYEKASVFFIRNIREF